MISQLNALYCFEFKNAYMRPDSMWGGVLCFLLILMIMPFTLDISKNDISNFGPMMIWVAIIPSILLGANGLFLADLDDGFMDRYLIMDLRFEWIFIIKICVLLCSIILPLLCALPIAILLFSMPLEQAYRLGVGLVCSLPAIAFFTGFSALLSLHTKMGHLLTFIITIPLIIPSIILGAGIIYIDGELLQVIKLPIIFSLFSILMTVPASNFLYKQLYHYY